MTSDFTNKNSRSRGLHKMKPPMNTEQPSRNQTKVLHVFFACFAPFGESPAQDSPRSREDFAKKNPFLPAKDFRVSSTEQLSRNSGDLCSSVFICVHLWFRLRFHQKSDFWISPSTSSADRARGRPVRSISFLSRRSRIWLALRSTSRGRPASRATSMP